MANTMDLPPWANQLGVPLVPAGDHSTIPAAMRNRQKELFEYGKCDKSACPGTGSKLYYINSWAMCWPSNHAKKPLSPDWLRFKFAPSLHQVCSLTQVCT